MSMALQSSLAEVSRAFFDTGREVHRYVSMTGLQPPELMIRDEIGASIADGDMLDVGVGGGRTTEHFAGRVGSYLGIDISPGMIEACRQRFPGLAFAVSDAAQLSLPDASVDFVLFSFNGIDYADRDRALSEFYRVLRPGGFLAFSSHNLNFVDSLRSAFSIPMTWNARSVGRHLKRRVMFERANPVSRWKNADLCFIYEGNDGYRFRFPTCYVRPGFQKDVLAARGWKDIRLFPFTEGPELRDVSPSECKAPWIYYLCRR